MIMAKIEIDFQRRAQQNRNKKKRKLLNDIRLPSWRNRLARSAVNRKVGGSNPPGGELIFCSLKGSNMGQIS